MLCLSFLQLQNLNQVIWLRLFAKATSLWLKVILIAGSQKATNGMNLIATSLRTPKSVDVCSSPALTVSRSGLPPMIPGLGLNNEHPFFEPARKMYQSLGFEETNRTSGGPDSKYKIIEFEVKL